VRVPRGQSASNPAQAAPQTHAQYEPLADALWDSRQRRVPQTQLSGGGYRSNVAARSAPTLTILIGAPHSCSIRFTYRGASFGKSSNLGGRMYLSGQIKDL
jgi:hypothetical protein